MHIHPVKIPDKPNRKSILKRQDPDVYYPVLAELCKYNFIHCRNFDKTYYIQNILLPNRLNHLLICLCMYYLSIFDLPRRVLVSAICRCGIFGFVAFLL